jgi:hypothetical protein
MLEWATIQNRLQEFRTASRPVFHWKYSGVFIPIFFGTGIAMALANKFPMAYACFALFGLWSVFYWLNSGWLTNKRHVLNQRATRRNPELLVREARKYCLAEWGVSAALIAVAVGFIFWAMVTKRQFEQDNVFQNLIAGHFLEPGTEDDPMHTMFSVTNGSKFEISKKHRIVCFTRLAVADNGIHTVEGMYSAVIDGKLNLGLGSINYGADVPLDMNRASRFFVPSDSILESGNGDGETVPCLKFYHVERPECVDMTVIFWYSLESQPTVERTKEFRYVAYRGKNGQFQWDTQPIGEGNSYCREFIRLPP